MKKAKRKYTIWDWYIHYDYKKNRLIITCRDVAWGGVWEYFNHDGIKVWWTKGLKIPKHWVLIGRMPEGSL